MVVPVSTTWQWPPEVLEFAARHNLQPYLEPLRQATLRLFPTAHRFRILLERDAEISNVWYLLFDLQVPEPDVPNYVEAHHQWNRDLFSIVPAPLVHFFVLFVDLVAP